MSENNEQSRHIITDRLLTWTKPGSERVAVVAEILNKLSPEEQAELNQVSGNGELPKRMFPAVRTDDEYVEEIERTRSREGALLLVERILTEVTRPFRRNHVDGSAFRDLPESAD